MRVAPVFIWATSASRKRSTGTCSSAVRIDRARDNSFCQNGTESGQQTSVAPQTKRPNSLLLFDLRPRPLAAARSLRNTAKSRGALPFLAAGATTLHTDRGAFLAPCLRRLLTESIAHLIGGLSR